jgi:creatinine amidohydrolase
MSARAWVLGAQENKKLMQELFAAIAAPMKAPIGVTTLYTLPHASGAYAEVLEDQKEVHHACEAETSMMMAAFPDCVRAQKISEAFGASEVGSPMQRPLLVFNSFTELTAASGVIGDARRASAAKGEKLFDIAVSLLAEKLIAGEPLQSESPVANCT